MEYFEKININELYNLPTIKTNKKITYINIEASFDIETTSEYQQGNKVAYMYVWAFGIGYGKTVYYGRTWEEFKTCIDQVVELFSLNKDKRLVIYVHNLGYEFQFMKNHFEWESVFSVAERKPLKALTTDGIEFRDSYILSGFSLERTAKNLQTHKIEKAIGDLDYTLTRTHLTPLTDRELNYVKLDIDVTNAYINEQLAISKTVNNIPLTNTGRVRKYVRDKCYYTSPSHKKSNKGHYTRYRKIMKDLTIEPKEYSLLKRAFMGGFTHANSHYINQVLENVSSYDFTSSYPTVMIAEQFPMSKGFELEINSLEEFELACKQYCLIFNLRLTNITPKFEHENYLSESKCWELSGATINNGRINHAETLATTITEVDYSIMKEVYHWETIELSNIVAFHKGYLPKPIVESVLELYQDKTVLKDVVGSEVEYMLSKGMLNSTYGMSVTDIVKDEFIFDDGEWYTEKSDVEKEIVDYNNKTNRFLFYAWGIYITAYARMNLWTGILNIKEDYIYSDTDSIKLLNHEKHSEYFEAYNENVVRKMTQTLTHYKLDVGLLNPKTQEGLEKMLGVWDYEGTYSRFKTLGAKRYLIEDRGKLQLTVAGLSKQNGLNYMMEISENNHEKVFNMFDDNLYIPADRTGKMTHTYIDNPCKFITTDYLGTPATVETLSGVHLESCEFTLSISKQFNTFLNNLAKGYIYKGENHE